MVCPRKGVVVYLLRPDPLIVNWPVQPDPAFQISADKYIHDNFKMRIGVFDACDILIRLHLEIDFLPYFSDTGSFGGFAFFDLSTGKLPQPAKQAFRFSPGDENFSSFAYNTCGNMKQRCFGFLDPLGVLRNRFGSTGLTEPLNRAVAAAGLFRRAHQCAKFHHGLVECAAIFSISVQLSPGALP